MSEARDRRQQRVARVLGDPAVDAVGDDVVELAERAVGQLAHVALAQLDVVEPDLGRRGAALRDRPGGEIDADAPGCRASPRPSPSGSRRRRSRSPARARGTDPAARARTGSRPSRAGPDASAHTDSWSNGPRRRRSSASVAAFFTPSGFMRLGSGRADRQRPAQHDARGPRRDAARTAEGGARAARLRGRRHRVRRARRANGRASSPSRRSTSSSTTCARPRRCARASGRAIQRDGRTFEGRPPMVMECSYAVTAWTQAVEDEHRLLSQVLSIFFAYPRDSAGQAQRAARQRLAGLAHQGPDRAGQGREVRLLERGRRPVQGVARLRRPALGRVRRGARARSRSPHADRPHAPVRRPGAHGPRDAPVGRPGAEQEGRAARRRLGHAARRRHLDFERRRRALPLRPPAAGPTPAAGARPPTAARPTRSSKFRARESTW